MQAAARTCDLVAQIRHFVNGPKLGLQQLASAALETQFTGGHFEVDNDLASPLQFDNLRLGTRTAVFMDAANQKKENKAESQPEHVVFSSG